MTLKIVTIIGWNKCKIAYNIYSPPFHYCNPNACLTQTTENLIWTKEKSKIYYDKKINPLEVKIGNNVFLLKGVKIKNLDSHYIVQGLMRYWKF